MSVEELEAMLPNRWRPLGEASAEYGFSMLGAVTLEGSTARGQTPLLRRNNRRTGPVRQVRPLEGATLALIRGARSGRIP